MGKKTYDLSAVTAAIQEETAKISKETRDVFLNHYFDTHKIQQSAERAGIKLTVGIELIRQWHTAVKEQYKRDHNYGL